MPLNARRTNFVLPGIQARPTEIHSLMLMLILSYSRRGNRRRTEDYFYAFWNAVLGHLVYGHTGLCVAPQLALYVENGKSNAYRGAAYADTSLETESGRDAERRPDFVVMGIRAKNQAFEPFPMFPTSFSNWYEMHFQKAFPHILVELKTVPCRNLLDEADFVDELEYIFQDAWTEAQDQAAIAFRREDFRDLNSVLAILGVGEWWRFALITRKFVEMKSRRFMEFMGEEERKTKYKGKRSGDRLPRDRCSETSGSGIQGAPLKTFHGLDPQEGIRPDIDSWKPVPGRLTSNLLFGSPSSNQHFYFIHKYLDQVEPPILNANLTGIPDTEDDETNLISEESETED